MTHIKDGVGERLINIDPGIINDPAFRAAGWSSNGIDIKRTYSPPIPTAVTPDYFSAPLRSAGLLPSGYPDDDDDGGMITGRGSTDTVGPGATTKKRRRREPHEEEDSSDLSDESDDDLEGTQRAAQQIRFAKMPLRIRAGSSPLRSPSARNGPEVLITSPSRRSIDGRLQRGSLGAVEAIKQRTRADTTTSSEISSENELDPSVFQRRQINPPRGSKHASLLQNRYSETTQPKAEKLKPLADTIADDSAVESDDASLSSEFGETAESESLLDEAQGTFASSPIETMAPGLTIDPPSPKKSRTLVPNMLQALPPPRPISTVVPVSALGQAIRARQAKPTNPVECFARFSGKGVQNPLNIKIYAPFSEAPSRPFDMPLQKAAPEGVGDGYVVTVADAIGLSLWRYIEEGLKPPLPRNRLDVNRWTLRMVDDGEVEYDFPALTRTTAITDFTSNNNRVTRGRSRGKAYDEFALVEATDTQYLENKKLTPKYTPPDEDVKEEPSVISSAAQPSDVMDNDTASITTVIDKPFTFTARKQSATLADRPAVPTVHSTPRVGPPKLLKIHFTSLEAYTQTNTVEVTTDTYFAEVLDNVCKRWNLDKMLHFLRVTGTSTVAPSDRTVESIGTRTDLDLVRRRFAHDGAHGLFGSPGSSSPNAPLLLTTDTTPKKGKKAATFAAHPLSQKQDLWGTTGNYKRYNVIRKQPMSFTPSHQRTLLMDGDYMHILPGETGKTLFDTSAKTTTVPFSMIVGCKTNRRHPKTFRVVVFREREKKRYDFEAQTIVEAGEIVEEIRKGMEPFRDLMEGRFS